MDLSATDLRGEKLNPLESCGQLQQLFLTGCIIDKESVLAISRIAALQELDLSGTELTDEMLKILSALPNLKAINALGTKVTDKAAQQLKAHSPGLTLKVGD